MASIDIIGVHVGAVDDLENELVFSPLGNIDVHIEEIAELPGEVEITAGGRRIASIEEGDAEDIQVVATYADYDQRIALKALRGRLCQHRDWTGRCWRGTILSVQSPDLAGGVCGLAYRFHRLASSIEV